RDFVQQNFPIIVRNRCSKAGPRSQVISQSVAGRAGVDPISGNGLQRKPAFISHLTGKQVNFFARIVFKKTQGLPETYGSQLVIDIICRKVVWRIPIVDTLLVNQEKYSGGI